MKLTLRYPITRRSALNASAVVDERGREVGRMLARHPSSGWGGYVRSYYTFYPADGVAGVRQSDGRTIKAALAKAVAS